MPSPHPLSRSFSLPLSPSRFPPSLCPFTLCRPRISRSLSRGIKKCFTTCSHPFQYLRITRGGFGYVSGRIPIFTLLPQSYRIMLMAGETYFEYSFFTSRRIVICNMPVPYSNSIIIPGNFYYEEKIPLGTLQISCFVK